MHTHIHTHTVWCVAEAPSHALLWLHKESVFGGLQCGDAWHVGVKPPVKPTETGKGHRQQRTWRVSLRSLAVSVLSVWLCVCVGVEEEVGLWVCVHTSVFLETTCYETACSLTHMAQHWWRSISECEHHNAPPCLKPPAYKHEHTHSLTHNTKHTIDTNTQPFATTHVLTWSATYGTSLTLSFHCPAPGVIINQWWIHL